MSWPKQSDGTISRPWRPDGAMAFLETALWSKG